MTQATYNKDQQFQSLPEPAARQFVRESAIANKQQQGLSADKIDEIRMGKQDQSLTGDDLVYGLTHADKVWPQVQTAMGKQNA